MGRLILPESGFVYLDANAIIYSVEKIEPYRTLLQPLWIAAQSEQFVIMSSELTLLETLVKPLKEADTVSETTFRQLLMNSKEVRLAPITVSVLEKAAHLRATTGLKPPDAIHAATALTVGNVVFITNDPIFRRVPELQVIVLKEIV